MTGTTTLTLDQIDLTDPDLFLRGQGHEALRVIRNQDPVHWQEAREYPGFWSITKHADIVRVSRDPHTFSSAYGVGMPTDPQNTDESFGAGKMMLMTDPPKHARLRRLVNKGFTPRQIGALEPHVREIVKEILDEAVPAGGGDFVSDIAAKLPLAVICEMMGVPRQDWALIVDLTNRSIGSSDPEYNTDPAADGRAGREAMQQISAYFFGLMNQRRSRRGEDLVSVLVDAEVDGEKLTDEDILLFCHLLIVAGNETTRNATAHGMLALIEHPEQRELLLADLSLLPTAMEEVLRWASPVLHFARIVQQDTEIRGKQIRKGEKVIVWYPSGNRDEDIFPDPYRFDVTRSPNEHVAFGIGEHFCLGASLARLELRAMFEGLLERLPEIELAGEIQRLRSTLIGGIKHMPVRFTRA